MEHKNFYIFYFFTSNQELLYNLLVLHILLLVDNPEKVAVGLALLGTGRRETSLQTGQRPDQSTLIINHKV